MANATNSVGFLDEEVLPVTGPRVGVALSWEQVGTGVDLDLQAVGFDSSGKLLDAVYYNNLKAFNRGLTHSSDETTGEKKGLDEIVWVDFQRLPPNVGIIVFVAAAFSGGHLRDAKDGKLHILENSVGCEVAQFRLEESVEEVDLIAALLRGPSGWTLRIVNEPAQDGKHFVDILEPTIGNFIRKIVPGAPTRIKAAFAMEKSSLVDLPQTSQVRSINAGLGWDTAKGEVDLDVSAVLLTQGCAVVDTVFFGNLELHGVTHSGDNLTGEGSGDDEVISVDLEAVRADIHQIFFVINVYTKGQSFAQVANPFCRVLTPDGEEFCRFRLEDAGRESGLIMSRLLREPGNVRWGFQALGMPSRGSMWKDCLPDIMKYARMKPQQLQSLGSSADVGAASNTTTSSTGPMMDSNSSASRTQSFKVTVVSARGLRAADMNGKSDPYCICDVPGFPSARAKTKTIKKTLNPEWNETFELIGCTASSPGQPVLEFTLMDYDFFRDDLLGKATLMSDDLQSGSFTGDLDVWYSKTGDSRKLCGALKVVVVRSGGR